MLRNKNFKRFMCVVLSALLIVSNLVYADSSGSETVQYADIAGNKYESQLREWIDNGFIKGFPDGTFKPENTITRAEFMALVNRSFGFTETIGINYADVSNNNWFYSDVAKATKAGYMKGYNGNIMPLDPITRQEFAIVLIRLTHNEASVDANIISGLSDGASIPEWSKAAVSTAVSKGYFEGLIDKSFRPVERVTRLEVVAALDRAFKSMYKAVYSKEGTYGPASGMITLDGSVAIISPDVTLKNTVINGDLILRESIGDGNVYLENVTVKGTTYVSGGGEHSVVISNSSLGKVVVIKEGNIVRIVATGSTTIEEVELRSGAILKEESLTGDGFGEIVIADDILAGATVIFEGNFDNIQIDSNVNINIISGTINNLTLTQQAAGTTVNISQQASISILNLDAPVNITGQGIILTANVNVSGSTIEQQPINVVTAPGVNVTITNPAPIPAPSTGGGGGGGGSDDDDDDDPTPTVDISSIDDISIIEGDYRDISVYTSPSNADISVESGNTSIAVVSIIDRLIRVTGVASGKAAITVTASKSGYMSARETFEVTVTEPVKEVDKEALIAAITDAEEKADNAAVGEEEGNYPQSAVDALRAAIAAAKEVVDDEDATQEEVDAAGEALEEAILIFEAAVIKAPDTYVVTVLSNPADGGNVTVTEAVYEAVYAEVGNVFKAGDGVTVTAIPNEGYEFENWTDEEDSEVSDDNPYTFNMPANNVSLTANFEKIIVPVIGEPTPIAVGASNPSTTIRVTGDTFSVGAEEVDNWIIDVGGTGLTVSKITLQAEEGATTAEGVTIDFEGIAEEGTITFQAKAEALTSGNESNEVSLEIEDEEPTVEEASFEALNSFGIHEDKVYAGYELKDSKGSQIALVESNIASMTVMEPGATVAKVLTIEGETDPYLWFNVEKAEGAYVYTIVTKVGKTYKATLNWTAEEDLNWADLADTSWYNTTGDTFTIGTASELAGLAELVNKGNNFSGKTITLGADIDLLNIEWTSIGTWDSVSPYNPDTKPFKGTFDGGNHTVSNLKIDRPDDKYVGLFGAVNGSIVNLNIDNVNINGKESVGGLVGSINGSVTNVHAENVTINSTHWAGGIIGYGYCNISGCSVDVVTVALVFDTSINDNGDKAGGIIGFLGESKIIKDCTAADVNIIGVRDVGGMVGNTTAGVTFMNCGVSSGTVTADSTTYTHENPYAGGLCGRASGANVKVFNCSATNVEVTSYKEGYAGNIIGGPEENWVEAAALNENQSILYTSIQSAVSAANEGDIIVVSAGTYVEQVGISKNITITGMGDDTIIQAPDIMETKFTTSVANKPVIYINNAAPTIKDFVVDGAGKGNANYRMIGIGLYNAGATIDGIEIKDIRNNPLDGTQHGVGVYAYNDDDTYRQLTVQNCNIYGYQKNGMALSGKGLEVDVNNNTVTGMGATEIICQNGIQVSYGAKGSVTQNTIAGHQYTKDDEWKGGGSGILLYQADEVNVSDNIFGEDDNKNDININDTSIYDVDNEEELLEALADQYVRIINLNSDINLAESLVVGREVTIDGKGYSVDKAVNIMGDNVTIRNLEGTVVTRSDHGFSGIQSATAFFVNADGVVLENITVEGSSYVPTSESPASIAVIGFKGAEFTVLNSSFSNVTTGIFAHMGYSEDDSQNVLTAAGNTFTNVWAGIGGTEKTDLAAYGNTFVSIKEGGEGIGLGVGAVILGDYSGYDAIYLESQNTFEYAEGNKVKDYRAVVSIESPEQLTNAIKNQQDGQIWIIKDGEYDLGRFDDITAGGQTGWYFPITASNLTIIGESKGGTIITSDVESPNGAWASQDHISVWGDNVTIENITIKPKITTNKTIEVLGENFTIRNVDFIQRDGAPYEFAGSLYFNPQNVNKDIGSVLVENVLINDAWISCGTSVLEGSLALKNTTIDFRGSAYASLGYGVISKNDSVISVVEDSFFKVYVDDTIANLQTSAVDRMPAGATLILAEGTYYVPEALTVPDGVILDTETNGANIIVAQHLVDSTYTGTSGEEIGGVKRFTSIQFAIDAAVDGDTIFIAPGEYEGFIIENKNKITITGAGEESVIIKPTELITTGIGHKYTEDMKVAVLVNSSTDIVVEGLTVSGNGLHPDAMVLWNESTGRIDDSIITDTTALDGCQTGQGIAVDGSTGTTIININNTDISGFHKNALDIVDGNGAESGSDVNITVNMTGGSITGAGGTDIIAQNGLVFWDRAGGTLSGSITGVIFRDLYYTPESNDSYAVLDYRGNNISEISIQQCEYYNVEGQLYPIPDAG